MSEQDKSTGLSALFRLWRTLFAFPAWEYWPLWLSAVPIVGMYLWFAIRARHLFFFSNVNPAIPLGGAFGESKNDILKLLPPHVKPATAWIPRSLSFEEALQRIAAAKVAFPVIAKPDIGERGFLVNKIETPEALRTHLHSYAADFIVQEFLEAPIEAAVMFCRLPGGPFSLLSVCLKEFLTVRGDGHSTVRQLLQSSDRARRQLERLEREQPQLLDARPEAGQTIVVEPVGNHARGTKFVDACSLIDSSMTKAFETLCRQIPGVYFGRFDLKCSSIEALKRAEGKVMELNGVLADPAHVFDPSCGAHKAYREYYRQWRSLYEIYRIQRSLGVAPTPHREGLRQLVNYFQYKKRATTPKQRL